MTHPELQTARLDVAVIGTPFSVCVCVCVCVHAWFVRRRSYEWAERAVLSQTPSQQWDEECHPLHCTSALREERRRREKKEVSVWISLRHFPYNLIYFLGGAGGWSLCRCIYLPFLSPSLPSFILSSCLPLTASLCLIKCLVPSRDKPLHLLFHRKSSFSSRLRAEAFSYLCFCYFPALRLLHWDGWQTGFEYLEVFICWTQSSANGSSEGYSPCLLREVLQGNT